MKSILIRFAMILLFISILFGFLPTTLWASNAAATVVVPPVAVTQTDLPLVLSASTFDAISIDGTLAGTDRVTLTVTNGTVSLAQTTGLTFDQGDGTNDAVMTFGGTSAEINTALSTLTYTPTPSFAGRSVLTLAINGSQSASAALNIAVNAPIDGEAARNTILNGVSTIHGGVQPGNLVAFGPTAYVINHFDDGNAWMVASTLGQGRIIAVPDHQGLNMNSWGSEGDTGQFYKNGLAWLADSTALDVEIVTLSSSIAAWLNGQGYTNVTTSNSADLATDLISAEILISGRLGTNPSETTLNTYRNFLLNGGALFYADYGVGYSWWWNTPLPEIGSNILLREAGIAFASDWHWGNGTFDATLRASGQISATQILTLLDDSSGANDDLKHKTGVALGQLFATLPANDPLLLQLDQRYTARINSINPTPATPVGDAFDQALLRREAAFLQSQNVYEVTPHRTVTGTYGMVSADAPRISKTVSIDTNRTRFQFTGLYVPAGEVVTVTVPAALVGEGYRVQISTNTDNIAARDDWRRVPDIDRSFAINSSSTPVASAFGGALIINLGGNNYDSSPLNLGLQSITVEGAVEQPYFVLGQHTNAEWLSTLRGKPGLRAAFVSTHTIVTVPSSYIATLEDPETLMAWWDDVTAGQDELVGRLAPRTAAEIINVDIQNSAGAAHAGYPIQAWDIHWGNPMHPNLMTSGSWGDFHELGHNHQRGWWTFDGDGEVSVNIFSNFNLETDVSNANVNSGWGYSATPVTAINRAKIDLLGSPTYNENNSRWSYWFVLADVPGGWDNFRCAFRTYENDQATNSAALPTTNDEEQGQWLVRFSTCAGWDMKRMFVDTWELAATQAQIDAVAALPDYMPIATNYTSVDLFSGETSSLDLAGEAVSIDNVETLTALGSPAHGTLVNNGNGTVNYTSDYEFEGVDTFTYTLQSSAANSIVVTMTVNVRINGAQLETWYGIDGSNIDLLRNHANYPNSPDEVKILDRLETDNNRGSDFGSRLRAILIPPTSGDYTFWIATDDDGELLLSPNTDPNAAERIAYVDGWTGSREWDKYSSQQSVTKALVAGQRYYIEALIKEDGGGDNLAVAWQGPGITQSVISDDYLRLVELGASPVVTGENRTMDEDSSVTISVLPNDSDADGDVLIVGTARAAHGTVTIQLDGSLVYTPSADFNGSDTITYTVADKYAGHDTGVVNLTVNAVNDAPNVTGATFELFAGEPNGTGIGSISANDPDNDAVTLSITGGDPSGIFTIDNTGAISVANTAALTEFATYSLTVSAEDGHPTPGASTTIVVIKTYACDDPFVVSNSADSGKCTLRDALNQANDGAIITFHPRIAGQTIYLASTLSVNDDVTIDGGATTMTLSGDSDQDSDGDIQLLRIDSNPVYLYNLNIMDGRSSSGAMIVTWNDHAVISNTTFANNVSTQYGGGAIHSQSRVSIYNSTFSNNQSSGTGEVLSLRNSNNLIVHSTFANNGNGTVIGLSGGTGWAIHNTIITNTTGTACSAVAPTANSGNLIFDNSCDITRASSAVSDFRLAALDSTRGRLIHRLEADSPAVDNGAAVQCLAHDQRGVPRDDGACDIGAVEYSADPTLTLSGARTQNEGDSGTVSFTFTATLNAAVSGSFTVPYRVHDGVAVSAENDYIATSNTLTFTGSTGETQTFTILANGDTAVEADETFSVTLGSPSNGDISIVDSPQIGTIANDDTATVTLANGIMQNEGSSGTTAYIFTATLSAAVQNGFTVPFNTNNGSATLADNDYTDNDGNLTFSGNAGETQLITVLVTGDTTVENNETFTVSLGSPSNASVSTANSPQTATITNDDGATITLSNGIAQNEGDSGTVAYVFTATLNAAVDGGVTVAYSTDDGTATVANNDYVDNDGALSFSGNIGESHTITVLATGDTAVEDNETFSVSLGTPSNASVSTANSPQTATITNDDGATITLSGGIAQNESDSGTTAYIFTTTLNAAVDGGVTVAYSTNDGTATVANNDYVDNDGALSFSGNVGESHTITVLATGDSAVEDNETFSVSLGTPSNASVSTANSPQTTTITNDDGATIALSAGIAQNEGNSGTTAYIFTATLNAAVDGGVTVAYSTNDGTATVANNDYADNDGALSFSGNVGEMQLITVLATGDSAVEDNETFSVSLDSPSNASVSTANSPQTATITNDDGATITLSGGIAQNEGDSDTVAYVFTATLNAAVDGGVTVAYSTNDGTATVANNDYVDNDGALSFSGNAGETQLITVLATGDTAVEDNETFTVLLGSPSNASVSTANSPQTATITNDDGATITLSGGIAQNEGNSGTTAYVFTATLNAAVDGGVTVAYSTNDGTATVANNDYVDNDGALSFSGNAGESHTITVLATGDSAVEDNETFSVSLDTPSNASISTANSPQTATITNDDGATITLSGGVAQNEGDSGTTAYVFTATLNAAVDGGVTVAYSTNDGTATVANNDYVDNDGVLSFSGSAGETQLITVLATGDTVVENSETFTVSLGTPSKPNLSVANSPQTATITNDDGATITLSAGIAQNEGDSGTTAYVFTATLSAAVDGGVTVVYSADDGTATVADNDYIDSNGTLSFSGNAGETQTITILVTGDTKVELNEQFNVALGVPSNSSISTLNSPQTATIQNEDTASLSISDVTVAEGNSGTTSTTLTVTLSAAVDTAFSVAFASADNSATTAHNDYLASSGTLTFAGNANEQQTITLAFIGDEIVELDETFSVTLSTLEASGRNVTLLDDQGRITLTNEDVATLSITDVAQSETNSGTTTFVLSATLNAAVDMGLSVNFATADGTATAGSDYTAGNGTLLFSGTAGEVRTIQIEVMGDADIEPNETFSVTLEGISAENRNITLSNPTAIATIINDEIPSVTAVELSASPHIANEATFNWGILLLVILLSSGSAYVFMASRSKKSRHPQT